MFLVMSVFSENALCRHGSGDVAPTPDLELAVETIQSLRFLRQRKLNDCERILAVTELQKIRSLLIESRKAKPSIDSGKIVYLSMERWRRTGYSYSDTPFASDDMALLREAFETHPALGPTQKDKVTEIIREVDLTMFELQRRSRPVSTILRAWKRFASSEDDA